MLDISTVALVAQAATLSLASLLCALLSLMVVDEPLLMVVDELSQASQTE